MTIITDKEVNTTIAYQDNFKSKQEIKKHHNLLVINENTEIEFIYPNLFAGIFISLIGLVLTGMFFAYNIKERRKQE